MEKNKVKIERIAYFTKGDLVTPLTQLRIVGPLHFENIEIQANLKNEGLNEDAFNNVDLIVLQRDFPDDLLFFKTILKHARSLEIPVVFDLDDNLLALPENHPDRLSHHFASSLLPIYEALLLADYVTVSTEKLKQTLESFNENIYVLPNFLDDSLWPFHLPIRQNKTKPITIGYMGGESHKPDIEWITPVLEKINKKFDEVNFHFYGVKPPEAFVGLTNVKYTELKTYHYKEFIDDFHRLNIDIFIAPLVDNLFNQCKSPIKYFEYSTMGVPGVFSDIEPYKNVVIDGENGLLAKSLDDWVEKLAILIQEPDLRYELAKNAQEAIRSNWLMSENAHLWTETYKKFIQMGPRQHSNGSISEIIDSISLQLHDYHHNQNAIIAEKHLIKNALEEKEKAIQTQIEQLSDQKSIIQSLSDKHRKQEQVTQNLQKKMTERDEAIQLLNQKIKEKQKANQSLSNKLSEQESFIQSLNENLSIKEKGLSSLDSQLIEKGQTIEKLKLKIENQNKELTSKINLIIEKEHAIDSLTAKIKSQSKELSSNDSQLAEKSHTVNNLEKQIENQYIEIGSLKEKLSEMEEEILFYSLSKSWRLTRPIRRFVKFIKGDKND